MGICELRVFLSTVKRSGPLNCLQRKVPAAGESNPRAYHTVQCASAYVVLNDDPKTVACFSDTLTLSDGSGTGWPSSFFSLGR